MEGVRIVDHAVLRIAGWPVETLDAFAAVELAEAASGVSATAASIEARVPGVVAAIHEAVPRAPDRDVRAWLLSVKRGIHGGTGPLGPPPPAVADRLHAADPETAAVLERELEERARLAERRRRFDTLFAAELRRQRVELHRIAATLPFRRALEIGNPALAARWKPGADATALSGKARDRRRETSIFHTLMRAVGRPTPQGAWAAVACVRPSEQGGGSGWAREPAPARRCVAVDLGPFAATLAVLRRLPRYRASALRLNPTVRQSSNGWRYERVTASGFEWAPVPCDEADTLLVEAYRDGRSTPVEPMIRALAGSDASRSAALQEGVARLLAADVLEVDLALPRAAETPWAALDAVTEALLPEDRSRWTATVGRVRRICERLGRDFDELDTDEVGTLRRAVEAEIEGLWRWVGLGGRISQPVLHMDTRAPFDMGWNAAIRRDVEQAVAEVLAFHRADGAAERYRRASLAGVEAAMRTTDDHTLLGLVDGTGLRRPPAAGDDGDTFEGIFARFTGGSAPDVEAHCRRWERRLEPVHAQARVIFDEDEGGGLSHAGPEGAFVLSWLPDGSFVAEWGRPQATMFVARLTRALANGDGELPHVTEVRRRADALRARGVVAAEAVGSDPLSLNAAVQPRLAPRRLEPHGPRESILDGLRLELDPDSHRPWIVGPDGERIFPVYHSSAAIGGFDPCSWLLFRLAMGHGWEFPSFGFPALARERASWLHLPRLVLPRGTVLSAERWTIPAATLQAILQHDEPGRYLAWRALIERLGLPAVARVRWDPHPAAPPMLMRTDSPLAVSALFLRLPPDSPRLVVTEIPGGLEGQAVRSPTGEHHLAELAVSWYDDSYWDAPEGPA